MIEVESNNPFLTIYLPILLVFIIAAIAVFLYFLKRRYQKQIGFNDAQNLVMLQVLVPRESRKENEPKEDFRETISVAEQLLSVFNSLYKKSISNYLFGQQRASLEIVAKNGEILFFIGVPKPFQNLVEKQIHSYYPNAQVEINNNFKIFNDDLMVACGGLKLKRRFVYPIKTYKTLESDPLNGLTNTLSKLGSNSRASIQIILKPTTGNWRFACSRLAKNIQEGKPIYENKTTRYVFAVMDWFASVLRAGSSQSQVSDKTQETIRLTPMQEEILNALKEKGAKIGFKSQIRIAVLSPTEAEANMHLENILSSFNQYTSPERNSFKRIKGFSAKNFLTSFILRSFDGKANILTTEELASVYHFPNKFIETPNIKWLLSKNLAPPVNLPQEGIILGKSVYRGEEKLIKIKNEDRRRHLFMIGKTGVGKTTLFENMIIQDIINGKGVAFIDPLGDAIEHILGRIPKERAEDVVLFDPSDTGRPVGLNLLEWERPEDKDFLIAEWIEIFYKLFDPNRTGMVGPQFEHWGRNASLTVMSQPGGGTLIEIPRLFTDDAFREECVSRVKDPVVGAFWKQQLAKTADFHKSEMYNYVISKFGRFMTNDLIRNIIGQKQSAFNFREIMDQGKILLVNLSKGKIGETNSNLLGMILVSKLQVAAFSRADIPEEERRDFYLYVDEFQNFTTDTFKTILSEARKYHLNLNITNQYVAQLTETVRDAVVGNVGTMIIYRIGAADSEFMIKEFPGVTEQDMVNLDKYNMYIKLLIDLTPSKPFSMMGMLPPVPYSSSIAQATKELSRLKYGRDKALIDEEFRSSWVGSDDNKLNEVLPRETSLK